MNIVKLAKNLFSNRSGNIAITFAIALMPLMLSIGAAIDYSRASALRNKIAQATDAALLASAAAVMEEVDMSNTAAVNARLNAEFEPFFLANMSAASGYQYNGFSVVFDPATLNVTVDVDIDYDTAVFGIIGQDTWEVDVVAATGMQLAAGGAISMYLVLDRSGSMGWTDGNGGIKLESLQTAVDEMTANLKTFDPNEDYVRVGAVAYNDTMSASQDIEWDLDDANDYVQALNFFGGTDSSDAIEEAYDELRDSSELTEHMAKSGQVPDLVLVFMTDGDNNYPIADTDTLATCTQAKNYGMEVYTIAFQAPPKGQALLNSCSSGAGYYLQPQSTQELIDAFAYIGAKVAQKLTLTQ